MIKQKEKKLDPFMIEKQCKSNVFFISIYYHIYLMIWFTTFASSLKQFLDLHWLGYIFFENLELKDTCKLCSQFLVIHQKGAVFHAHKRSNEYVMITRDVTKFWRKDVKGDTSVYFFGDFNLLTGDKILFLPFSCFVLSFPEDL